MLLIQYCLGISVNLYPRFPATDHDKSLFGGFVSAVGNGPVLLTLHALLGTLLLITATSGLIRSARIEAPPLIGPTAIALAAIIIAWLSVRSSSGTCKPASPSRSHLSQRSRSSATRS